MSWWDWTILVGVPLTTWVLNAACRAYDEQEAKRARERKALLEAARLWREICVDNIGWWARHGSTSEDATRAAIMLRSTDPLWIAEALIQAGVRELKGRGGFNQPQTPAERLYEALFLNPSMALTKPRIALLRLGLRELAA